MTLLDAAHRFLAVQEELFEAETRRALAHAKHKATQTAIGGSSSAGDDRTRKAHYAAASACATARAHLDQARDELVLAALATAAQETPCGDPGTVHRPDTADPTDGPSSGSPTQNGAAS